MDFRYLSKFFKMLPKAQVLVKKGLELRKIYNEAIEDDKISEEETKQLLSQLIEILEQVNLILGD